MVILTSFVVFHVTLIIRWFRAVLVSFLYGMGGPRFWHYVMIIKEPEACPDFPFERLIASHVPQRKSHCRRHVGGKHIHAGEDHGPLR